MQTEKVMQVKKVWFELENDGDNFMLLASSKDLKEFLAAMDDLETKDSAPAECHQEAE